MRTAQHRNLHHRNAGSMQRRVDATPGTIANVRTREAHQTRELPSHGALRHDGAVIGTRDGLDPATQFTQAQAHAATARWPLTILVAVDVSRETRMSVAPALLMFHVKRLGVYRARGNTIRGGGMRTPLGNGLVWRRTLRVPSSQPGHASDRRVTARPTSRGLGRVLSRQSTPIHWRTPPYVIMRAAPTIDRSPALESTFAGQSRSPLALDRSLLERMRISAAIRISHRSFGRLGLTLESSGTPPVRAA